jgi:glycosyltransferase involved in cell wall biosynthesis
MLKGLAALKPLDLLNLCYIWLKSYPSLKKIWGGQSRDNDLSIRLNYGYDSVPGPDEHVFGGLVKLQDLNKAFPQSLENPTVLYLVSSALPYFPVRLAETAKKSGAKLVINQNGVAYPGWYGKGWERANRPMKRLLAMADYVFYQSEFCRISADRFLGAACGKCGEILYNPVDTDFFRPLKAGDGGDARLKILLSGSHWTPYRVLVALDTLQLARKVNKQLHLVIAGRFCWHEDPAQAEQEVFTYADKKGVRENIDFIGSYRQEDAPQLLNSCSLLLHTKYNDPCPRLVVEAMACGLPVAYSATGGVPELVGSTAGIGVAGPLDYEKDHPPGAPELAKAILNIVNDLDSYALAARQRAVQNFDVTPWLDRHRAVFKKLF